MGVALYQGYDAAALEAQYDIEATRADYARVLDGYQMASDHAKGACDGLLDQAYGDDPLQKLDVYRPNNALRARRSPVMIYFHGGYWRMGDKAGRAFPAPVFTKAGAIWVSANYRLAPDASMDEIVEDACSAVAWVYRNALAIGADRERIFVSGGSAGGHLTGMLLTEGWQARHNVPQDTVKGAIAASGLYDLTPFQFTSQDGWLGLEAESIQRNSPMFHLPAAGPPLVVSWGGQETSEFERQSEAYADAYEQTGAPVIRLPLPDEDHFTLMGQMQHAGSPLTMAMLATMGLR